MFTALAIAALVAVPAQAQGGQLKLTNIRILVGDLGPIRPNAKFLPGDWLILGYDINGLAIEADGIAKYKMEYRVLDNNGKQIFKKDSRELTQFAPLRGNVIPARAYIIIGLDQDAGNYVLEVTVEDPKSKTNKDTITTKFEVAKREFGIVNVRTTHDEAANEPAPNIGVVGQTIFVQYVVATFERDPKTKQPKLEFQFQYFDEKGNPTLPEPHKLNMESGVDDKEGLISMRFPLFMNRPGKFTVKITAIDKVANKKSTYDLPVTILAPN